MRQPLVKEHFRTGPSQGYSRMQSAARTRTGSSWYYTLHSIPGKSAHLSDPEPVQSRRVRDPGRIQLFAVLLIHNGLISVIGMWKQCCRQTGVAICESSAGSGLNSAQAVGKNSIHQLFDGFRGPSNTKFRRSRHGMANISKNINQHP